MGEDFFRLLLQGTSSSPLRRGILQWPIAWFGFKLIESCLDSIPMSQETKFKIEEYLNWTAMLIYAAVWFLSISMLLEPRLILVAAVTSATYVSCQVYEILKNGNCYIWADQTAAPISFAVLLVLVLIHCLLGYWSWELETFFPLALYTLALMGGHLIAISFSTGMGSLLNKLLRVDSKE